MIECNNPRYALNPWCRECNECPYPCNGGKVKIDIAFTSKANSSKLILMSNSFKDISGCSNLCGATNATKSFDDIFEVIDISDQHCNLQDFNTTVEVDLRGKCSHSITIGTITNGSKSLAIPIYKPKRIISNLTYNFANDGGLCKTVTDIVFDSIITSSFYYTTCNNINTNMPTPACNDRVPDFLGYNDSTYNGSTVSAKSALGYIWNQFFATCINNDIQTNQTKCITTTFVNTNNEIYSQIDLIAEGGDTGYTERNFFPSIPNIISSGIAEPICGGMTIITGPPVEVYSLTIGRGRHEDESCGDFFSRVDSFWSEIFYEFISINDMVLEKEEKTFTHTTSYGTRVTLNFDYVEIFGRKLWILNIANSSGFTIYTHILYDSLFGGCQGSNTYNISSVENGNCTNNASTTSKFTPGYSLVSPMNQLSSFRYLWNNSFFSIPSQNSNCYTNTVIKVYGGCDTSENLGTLIIS